MPRLAIIVILTLPFVAFAFYMNDDVASAILPSGNIVTWSYAPNAENRSDPMARPLLVRQDLLGVMEQRSMVVAK